MPLYLHLKKKQKHTHQNAEMEIKHMQKVWIGAITFQALSRRTFCWGERWGGWHWPWHDWTSSWLPRPRTATAGDPVAHRSNKSAKVAPQLSFETVLMLTPRMTECGMIQLGADNITRVGKYKMAAEYCQSCIQDWGYIGEMPLVLVTVCQPWLELWRRNALGPGHSLSALTGAVKEKCSWSSSESVSPDWSCEGEMPLVLVTV